MRDRTCLSRHGGVSYTLSCGEREHLDKVSSQVEFSLTSEISVQPVLGPAGVGEEEKRDVDLIISLQ